MTNKPTDAEIIKALECCISDGCTCKKCAYEDTKHIINEEFELMPNGKHYDDWSCDEWLKKDLFDLINRLKAENEQWKKNCDELYEQMSERQKAEVAIAKRLAIKEFAERLKEYSECYSYVTPRDIDNLVKNGR